MHGLLSNDVCFPQKMATLAQMKRCLSLARPQKQGMFFLFVCLGGLSIPDLPLIILHVFIKLFLFQLLSDEIISQSG